MTDSPTTLRLPPDYREAFEAAAGKAGVPLGQWIRDAAASTLPAAVRRKLVEPRRPGRPQKVTGGE